MDVSYVLLLGLVVQDRELSFAARVQSLRVSALGLHVLRPTIRLFVRRVAGRSHPQHHGALSPLIRKQFHQSRARQQYHYGVARQPAQLPHSPTLRPKTSSGSVTTWITSGPVLAIPISWPWTPSSALSEGGRIGGQQQQSLVLSPASQYYRIWSINGYNGVQKIRGFTNFQDRSSDDNIFFRRYSSHYISSVVGRPRELIKLYSQTDQGLNRYLLQSLQPNIFAEVHHRSYFNKYLFSFRSTNETFIANSGNLIIKEPHDYNKHLSYQRKACFFYGSEKDIQKLGVLTSKGITQEYSIRPPITSLFGSPKKAGLDQQPLYRLLQQQKQQEQDQAAQQLAIGPMKLSLISSLHIIPFSMKRQAHHRRSNRGDLQKNPYILP